MVRMDEQIPDLWIENNLFHNIQLYPDIFGPETLHSQLMFYR